MTYEDYLAIPAARWSEIKHLSRSLLHYEHARANPTKDTPALAFGRLVHCAALEPREFPDRYGFPPAKPNPSWKRNTKEGKERFARYLAEHPDVEAEEIKSKEWQRICFAEENPEIEVVARADYQRAMDCAASIRRHPIAARYLAAGLAEHVIEWRDPFSTIACKGRADWISTSAHAIVDIKTTRDVDARAFGRDAAKHAYHAQLAFYRDGYGHQHRVDLDAVIIAVESAAPHDVAVYRLGADDLAAGQAQYQACLQALAKREAARAWPGRYPDEQALQLPRWIWDDEGDEAGGLDLDFEETANG